MKARPVAFCISCDEKKEYVVKAFKREITVKGITFSYVHKNAYCGECGEELYAPEINDANAQAREDAYKNVQKATAKTETQALL